MPQTVAIIGAPQHGSLAVHPSLIKLYARHEKIEAAALMLILVFNH
jgi:hypothetical protein